jgi:hypothetical protein
MSDVSLVFLFLDESMDESLDLASLTGVLVPLHAYRAVRDAICRLVWDVLAPPPNTVPQPIELHARKLLPELDHLPKEKGDAARLHVLQSVTAIVNEHGLQVLRVCYTNRAEIAAMLKGDPKLYALNFFGIQTGLQDLMETTLVLPVMDGVPGATEGKKAPSIDTTLIRAFAANVRWIHHARHCDAVSGSLSIKNAHNLAEPVFGDSAHATLLQLVDLVSYLLLQRDRAELMPDYKMGEFKTAVLKIGQGLDARLLTLWRGKMELNT